MASTGPVGKERGTFFVILMSIITFGIYAIYWVYSTHDEIKRHSGEGVGGGLGIVIYFVAGVVTPFLIGSEVGKMYQADGRTSPVSGKTGLWVFPGIFILIGPIIWLAKVQGALNDYWKSKATSAAPAAPAPAAS